MKWGFSQCNGNPGQLDWAQGLHSPAADSGRCGACDGWCQAGRAKLALRKCPARTPTPAGPTPYDWGRYMIAWLRLRTPGKSYRRQDVHYRADRWLPAPTKEEKAAHMLQLWQGGGWKPHATVTKLGKAWCVVCGDCDKQLAKLQARPCRGWSPHLKGTTWGVVVGAGPKDVAATTETGRSRTMEALSKRRRRAE